MNRMKAPSYIMKYRELILKVPERKINTSLDDEGTIADNEGMKGIILGFFLQTPPHNMVSSMNHNLPSAWGDNVAELQHTKLKNLGHDE